MMSGSWRRNARSAAANVSPAFSLTLTWLTPASWISAGSSAVEMLTPGLVQDVEAGVERDRLAAAGRAGDEDHAVRPADRVQQRCLLVGLVAQRLDAELDARRIEDPHHDLLAEERRQRADAEVDRLGLRQHELHPAVLRHALFRDVELGDHLDPRRDLVLDHERRLRDLHQDAVEPVADAVELLVRLEVDVRDAGADRVEQDLLDVLDDRRVLDLGAFLVAAPARLSASWRSTSRSSMVATSFSVAPEASTSLWIAGRELVVLDDDRLDDEVGLEPDFLQRLQVGRVGGGDEEPVAALVQRQNAPRLGNLEVDQVLRGSGRRRSRRGRAAGRRTRATRTPRAASPSSACRRAPARQT